MRGLLLANEETWRLLKSRCQPCPRPTCLAGRTPVGEGGKDRSPLEASDPHLLPWEEEKHIFL